MQAGEGDQCTSEADRLERLDIGRGGLTLALALGEERLGTQEGPDIVCG